MRHLINKHYDTPGGLLGHPTNVSSHPKPPVSIKEDETMKNTQGKWSVHNFECADRNGGCFIKDNDGEDLAKVYGDREEDLANAILIASAPEMLKALKMVKKAWENSEVNFECNESNGTGYVGTHHLIKKTLDAIGKAEKGE